MGGIAETGSLRAGWAFLPGIKGKAEQSTDEILSTTDLPSTHSSKYRPDIDGLRAIAVGSVVAFHTGIPGVQGGFTGVDIFFVLSGFLITGILISEMDQGIFSYANFYERRVRRILPALFVMMGIITIPAALFLIPSAFETFGMSAGAAALSVSNFFFWTQSGYFNGAAAEMPLLHTWSLAIEEQFYIFLPPYLLLMRRWTGWPWISIIAPVVVVSFAMGIVTTDRAPGAAFYFPFGRMWELGVGALAAAWPASFSMRNGHRWREAIAIAGLVMILCAITLYSENTKFPGIAAALPCLGTVMILQANRGYRTRLGMVLSYKPFVFMGLISYSLYLWHWPVLVLTKLTLNAPPTSVQKAAMLLVMVALAIVSWRFVERPFRRSRERTGRTRLFAAAAAIIILFSGFGLLAKVTQGSPNRFSGPLRSLAVADQDVSHYRDKCDRPSLDRIHRGDICIIGSPGKPATVALFGDSHADALIPGLEAAAIASGTGMSLYSRTGCHPLFGADWCSGSKARLTQLDAMAAAVVADPQIRSVIMIGRWPELAESSRYGSDDKPNAAFLKDDQTKVGGHAENLRVLDRSFGRMMAALPGKNVFVVLGIPEQRIDVPQIVFSRKQLGLSEPTGITRAEYDARQRDARATLVNASKKYGFTLIDLSETACDTHYCPVVKGGKPLYFDDHHLSGAGALRFKTLLERAFYSGNSAVSQPPLPQPQIAAPTSVKL